MRRKIRSTLKFLSEIAMRIPGKNDTTLQKIGKAVGIAEKIYSLRSFNAIDDFMKDNKLVRTMNGVMVELLFKSNIMDHFIRDDIRIETNTGYGGSVNILELKHKELGSLYFVERVFSSGQSYKEVSIMHKSDYDFPKLMELFWNCYDGKIFITFNLEGFSCSEFPAEKLQIYGKNAEIARDLAIQHLKYASANIPRAYLLLGTPGTGKSSCAMLFASKLTERVLKIEASALAHAGKDLRFILSALKPDFVLIDDIDKDKTVRENMASVLTSVEWLKTSNPKVTIVFTANKIDILDKAFWRPGRVDSITIFEDPSKEDRIDIIKGFIEQFKVVLPEGYTVERIVNETDGMSPVWLREIILRFKYDDPSNVIGICRQMFNVVNDKPIAPVTEDATKPSNGHVENDEGESKNFVIKDNGIEITAKNVLLK